MNSLQDLIKRLSAIGQVNEAEEKCSKCDCTPCECDDKEKVDEVDMGQYDAVKAPLKDKDTSDWDKNFREKSKQYAKELEQRQKEKVEEAKKPDADKDGVPDWADKKPGSDDNEEKVDEGAMDKLKQLGKQAFDKLGGGSEEDLIKDLQKKSGVPQTGKKPGDEKEVNETALNLLRRYAGIQEATIEEDEVEEGNEFSGALKAAKDAGKEEFKVAGKKYKVNECGEMPMGADMSPMSSVPNGEPHMGIPAEVMAQMAAPEQGPEMAQPEMAAPEAPKATYTLSIQNGENNLQMTTDMPDEIIHIMKLAGVNKGAEVTKKETPADSEQEVEESGYENTPDNTNARDPQAHGDIRDWGRKGTANASTHYTPAKSGDNPMNEQRMFDDYKNFKAGK